MEIKPRHGKSLEGNKEDTWPIQPGQLPSQGAASGSSPAPQQLGRLSCLGSTWAAGSPGPDPAAPPALYKGGASCALPSSHRAKTPSAPAPTAPCARGFGARRKGAGKNGLFVDLGVFSFIFAADKWARRLPWEGEGKPWLFSQSSPIKGRGEASGDGAVGGRRRVAPL